MSDRPPLRLIPSPRSHGPGYAREAADAALVEAILDGLPPGGRVRLVGPAPWLADALGALGAEIVTDPAVPVDVAAFALTPLAEGARVLLGRARDGLDAGGRVVIGAIHPAGLRPYEDAEADVDGAPAFVRTMASWVQVLGASGLTVRSLREPLDAQTDAPAGLVIVAEPEASPEASPGA